MSPHPSLQPKLAHYNKSLKLDSNDHKKQIVKNFHAKGSYLSEKGTEKKTKYFKYYDLKVLSLENKFYQNN